MALSVPLSRFTSRVGGGSAFYVRRHHAMSKTKKISVVVGVVLVSGAVAAFLIWAFVLRPQVVSRVPLPGSSMTAIITSDLAGCCYCQLFERGHPVSDLHILGSYVSGMCSTAHVSRASNIVTVDWGDGSQNYYAVAIDIEARGFVVSSNSTPSR